MSTPTPLMQQYFTIKESYPDTLLLFQVGDFYELFFEDAQRAAAFLGIALTARGKNNGDPIPLCGVPVHALSHYLAKLVKGGFKVAICDQLEEAVPGKMVHRGVTQVLTPGTLTDAQWLDEKSASYLLSFVPLESANACVFGELLTGQLFATVLPNDNERHIEAELARFMPDEVLVPQDAHTQKFQSRFNKLGYFTSVVHHDADAQGDLIKKHEEKLTQIARKERDALTCALRTFYAYVAHNQQSALANEWQLHIYRPDDFLVLDAATQRNLELVKNNHDGSRKHTLLSVIDRAITPMGSRMLKKWLLSPLVKKQAIEQRQDALAFLVKEIALAQKLAQHLQQIGDLERIVGRIALNRAQLHDYLALAHALARMPQIVAALDCCKTLPLFSVICSHMHAFESLHQLLTAACNADTTKDWIIAAGFDETLDEVRDLVENSNKKLVALEKAEQERTGIASLKVGYNQVHGYYIEITKANLHLVPGDYIRHQTLVGKERFLSAELQQLQGEINSARARIVAIEKAVFERVKKEVATYAGQLRRLAHAIAHCDALLGLSMLAYDNGYVRPAFHDERDIVIEDGCHPVVANSTSGSFIPNNTQLTDAASLWIITGPNMGGKSTYLRQVALIAIMAHIGSFVPARAARMPLIDRIFTRIGAGDNMAEGKSTFLVEMEETALICTQSTERSLVILDEVGRGTSTFDGLAIAQAVVEYIHTRIGARCLFATHYHELTHLQDALPGIKSYYTASTKTPNGLVFLYKIMQGVADGSFGVQVARLAQLPQQVIDRAQTLLTILTEHEKQNVYQTAIQPAQIDHSAYDEIARLRTALAQRDALVDQLARINYDELSPKKAFDLLWEMRMAMHK